MQLVVGRELYVDEARPRLHGFTVVLEFEGHLLYAVHPHGVHVPVHVLDNRVVATP